MNFLRAIFVKSFEGIRVLAGADRTEGPCSGKAELTTGMQLFARFHRKLNKDFTKGTLNQLAQEVQSPFQEEEWS
jgi:hypothetical protein